MARSVTVRRHAETAQIELRCGPNVLGFVTGLSSVTGGTARLVGRFTHAPAYAEHAERFLELAAALDAPDAAKAARIRAGLEAAGVHVHHTQHDMRIDAPATLSVVRGELWFVPNDAYLMMRTGGLG